MPRGLSPLQQQILTLAQTNRADPERGQYSPDLLYAEALVSIRGWPVTRSRGLRVRAYDDHGNPTGGWRLPRVGMRHFDRRVIGEAEYNRGSASLARAVRRLQARGLAD